MNKLELIDQIQSIGLQAMAMVASRSHEHGESKSNTAYFDCHIGSRITAMAKKEFAGKVPFPIEQYITKHQVAEQCHCVMFKPLVPSDLADRIAGFHEIIIMDHGWVSWLCCMPLLGERTALASAIFERKGNDPHATDKGALDEYYHTTYPLVLISLYATEQELEIAIKDMKKFLKILRTNGETYYDATNPYVCHNYGRDAHTFSHEVIAK